MRSTEMTSKHGTFCQEIVYLSLQRPEMWIKLKLTLLHKHLNKSRNNEKAKQATVRGYAYRKDKGKAFAFRSFIQWKAKFDCINVQWADTDDDKSWFQSEAETFFAAGRDSSCITGTTTKTKDRVWASFEGKWSLSVLPLVASTFETKTTIGKR